VSVGLTASDLVGALAYRHAKDVFVPECKMGESWGGGARRLDAWAMLRSWSPWMTLGYEVKVSRSDFLQDHKWQEYLPACHAFYIVVPAKLVAPEELPADVGLLWMIGGQRLVCKRKAVRRSPEPEALLHLMSYVLMSRTRVVANMHEANLGLDDKRQFWARWLEQDTGEHWLGHMVARRLAERVQRAEHARDEAIRDVARYKELRETVSGWGLDPDRAGRYDLERRFAQPTQHALGLRRLAEQLQNIALQMEQQ
jgi:hypothetical protein